jgi:hypothetical protein
MDSDHPFPSFNPGQNEIPNASVLHANSPNKKNGPGVGSNAILTKKAPRAAMYFLDNDPKWPARPAVAAGGPTDNT